MPLLFLSVHIKPYVCRSYCLSLLPIFPDTLAMHCTQPHCPSLGENRRCWWCYQCVLLPLLQIHFPPEIEHSYRCNAVVKRFKKLSGLQPSTLTSSCAGSPFGLQATKIGRRSRPCACLLERFGLHATRTPQHCKSFVESLRFGQTIWRSSQTRFTPPVRARARACVCATACDGIPPALLYC